MLRRKRPPPQLPPAGGPMTRQRRLAETKPPPKDHLSALPNDLLGEIVSLLPTKDGARTQALASGWRKLWRSSPLNIDYGDLGGADNDKNVRQPAKKKKVRRKNVAEAIPSIVSAHEGPCRRLCVKNYHLADPSQDAWLNSASLNGLQEIEFWYVKYSSYGPFLPLPPSIYRFSASLRVATLGGCIIPEDVVQGLKLKFPNLKQLALEFIGISERSLHSLIAGCPVLEGLLIHNSFGFHRLQIDSVTLRSICVRIRGHSPAGQIQFQELVVENAPCLENLITLRVIHGLRVSVTCAPKLDTMGFLTDLYSISTTKAFGSAVIQGFAIDGLASAVHTVKVLAVNMNDLTLHKPFGLMRFFPCLEKLHVKSRGSKGTNLWRRKHVDIIKCLDLRLKTVVLDLYIGTLSHISFATFFVRNAGMLELMTFHIDARDYSEEFLANQRKKLQLEHKASRGAQFQFTTHRCPKDVSDAKHLRDFDLYDPFACRCAERLVRSL